MLSKFLARSGRRKTKSGMVLYLATLLLFSMPPRALAVTPDSASIGHKETVRGYLVDLVCMKEEADKFPNFGPDHTKKCLQMPTCEQGGYAILLPSKEVLNFDEHGNELAKKFIAAHHKEKDFVIKVTAIRQENRLHVLRID